MQAEATIRMETTVWGTATPDQSGVTDDSSEEAGGEDGVGPGAGDCRRVFDIHRAAVETDTDLTHFESEDDGAEEGLLCGRKRAREDKLFKPAAIGHRAPAAVIEAA